MIRRSRQAFTLIEILVVIGIILVLIGIGVIGFQHLDKVASERATKTRLDLCASLLNEYESSVATMNAIEGAGPTGSPYPVFFSLGSGGNNLAAPVWYSNPGDVNLGSGSRTLVQLPLTAASPSGAVTYTAIVLQAFNHVPQVKTQIAQLPPAATLQLSPTNLALPNPQSPPNVNPLIILDAWKNPIIYVPATGLPVTAGGRTVTVTSVDGRPFWASAGQDGNFQNGDDNLYSTAVVTK